MPRRPEISGGTDCSHQRDLSSCSRDLDTCVNDYEKCGDLSVPEAESNSIMLVTVDPPITDEETDSGILLLDDGSPGKNRDYLCI